MKRRAARPLLVLVLAALGCWSLAGCRNLEPKLQALESDLAALGQKIELLDAKLEAHRLAPNDIVHIELQGVGVNTRIAAVDPPRKRACQPASVDCDAQVRWILSGQIPESWKVEIREKDQTSPSQCFPPADLSQSNRVATATPAEGCQKTGVSWEYDVILRDQNGEAKHRIDPLVV
ncbi:MAG TPA: hypothetical protein VMS86_01640, partial [Thermoanaerobaculia bacterium]|nr:hypothetical protein [Thermoanaerobaculia bacterium]